MNYIMQDLKFWMGRISIECRQPQLAKNKMYPLPGHLPSEGKVNSPTNHSWGTIHGPPTTAMTHQSK